MRRVENSIEVEKHVNGESYGKHVSLGPCPYCLGYEQIVSPVLVTGRDPQKLPNAILCGGCGAQGPWGKSEEEAVERWNAATCVLTEDRTEWRLLEKISPADDDGLSF